MDATLFNVANLRNSADRGANIAQIRSRTQSTYVGDGIMLCRVLGKYRFLVPSADYGLSGCLLLDGFWEIWITEFIARNVTAGATVVDVGANVGYYTILMGDLVGPKGRVVAFEPNPLLAKLVRDSAFMNAMSERVQLEECAASEASGAKLSFRIPRKNPKNARLLPAKSTPPRTDEQDITVETRRIDDFDLRGVSFMKIDVEGAEEAVWNGMQVFLMANPECTVLMEFNPRRCQDPQGTLQAMSSQFRLRHLDNKGRVEEVSAEEILAKPTGWMLVLSNGDPA